MILLTAGAQLPFERMGRLAFRCARALPDEKILYQAGPDGNAFFNQQEMPFNLHIREFIEPKEYQHLLQKARCVITHAGMGNLLYLLEQRIPFMVLPRLMQYNEHRNDHQLDTARAMHEQLGIEFYCDGNKLLDQLLTHPQQMANGYRCDDMLKRRKVFAGQLQDILLTLFR